MTTRLASSLCLGAALALGAFACGGSKRPAQDAGPDGYLIVECSPSDLDAEPDALSIAFPITIASLGVNEEGFDLDGVSSTASDANGCYQVDGMPMGSPSRSVDAQLSAASAATSALGLDVSRALADAVANGGLRLRMLVTKWNGTLVDGCIGVELQIDRGGGYVTTRKLATPMNNGITPEIWGLGAMPLELPIAITDPSICTPGSYGANSVPAAPACANAAFSCTTTLPLVLEDVKLRLHIVEDASHPDGFRLATSSPSATVTNPSMLGGYLVFWDTSAGRPGCTDAPLTDTNLEAALEKAACDLGLGAKWASDVCPAFADNLDLHDSAGTLSACAAGGSATTSNANAISLAAYVGD